MLFTVGGCIFALHFCRKLTKTKGGFANENSLLKLLYAGILKASERWTHPVQNWNLTLSQLSIHFEGRLDEYIDL
jgi:putative transposase